ncbi:MAG: hypothetical protein Ct9H300mP19_09350 [Dehalococcoidia bacterium]|nr:MAG: hypothetical protein Ct9H300mP19_09350 [Dehalococcoidia bacterium]
MINDLGVPAYQGYLNENSVTIAEVLKTAGYRTLRAGKWHVGGEQGNLPKDGIQICLGTLLQTAEVSIVSMEYFWWGSYYNPNMLMDDLTRISIETTDYHLTDAIASKATNSSTMQPIGKNRSSLHGFHSPSLASACMARGYRRLPGKNI